MGAASNNDDDLISGINVTPFVDVTLVLLVIFMVTSKMIDNQGMAMDLPKAASGEEIQTVFSVELSVDGSVHVDSKLIDGDEQIAALAKKAIADHPDLRAVIRADNKVEHGRVIHTLDVLKRAGIAKIAFAVAPTGTAGAKASATKSSTIKGDSEKEP